uniref:ATP synthase F0 subunit 8 n=1 Tax=Amaurobius fenestralis TaxID=680006 RepID=A0A7L7SAL6_9ARAC|nr:ATP synthase F0 subunit 8 [Amaurobius fenestralis]
MPQLMPLMWVMYFLFSGLIIFMCCLIFWNSYLFIEQNSMMKSCSYVSWKW